VRQAKNCLPFNTFKSKNYCVKNIGSDVRQAGCGALGIPSKRVARQARLETSIEFFPTNTLLGFSLEETPGQELE
jgi:hypothetical protein